MFQCKDLQSLVILVLVSAEVVTRTWSFQSNVLHTTVAHNPYIPLQASFPQRNPSAPTWQFSNNAGVPTWVITTTVIETRNETANPTANKDEDSPVGPNLREDAQMMAANENDDPDIEFPIRHGKDPAVHARPAFGDPDKYEETTSGPKVERSNQTKPVVTVNRTTVVKIEFHNTPFLPLVVNIGNAPREQAESKNDTSMTQDSDPQQYSGPVNAQGQPASLGKQPSSSVERTQFEERQPTSHAAKIDRAGLSPESASQVAPQQIVPNVQFPSYVPYGGAQLPLWTSQIPQNGVIYPYARFWRKK